MKKGGDETLQELKVKDEGKGEGRYCWCGMDTEDSEGE